MTALDPRVSGPSDPTLDRLFPELHGFGVKWGLEKTSRLLSAAGDPHQRYDVVHIAGTNGKGSVGAMVASVLRAAGHRVGLYSSPHLTHFNERFQVDGIPLSEDDLVRAADLIRPVVAGVEPTFFEATTAVGLTAFATAKVDVAVVEVGLGGRLDATNVVTPVVSVLTNVGMDHMQFLGDDLRLIASEKAGIAKPGVPFVTAVQAPDLLEVIEDRVKAVGATLTTVSDTEILDATLAADHTALSLQPMRGDAPIELMAPLAGPHQATNILLAVRVLEALPERLRPTERELRAGLAETHWPGRLQRLTLRGRSWLFDVAHNVPGVEAVVRSLREVEVRRPLIGVVGILSDKDWRGMTSALAGHLDEMILTSPPSAPETRSWDPHRAARWLRSRSVRARVRVVTRFERALAHAAEDASATIVVTGSCHTVGDAFLQLGVEPFPTPVPAPPPAVAVDFP